MSRILERIPARPASDGAGVNIKRVVPLGRYAVMDPFLMLDEIRSEQGSDYIAGFPPHPHRGFETITYLREGLLEHQDHMGNRGVIASGGAQWMTAGRGVIHSEMPLQEDGLFHGFQLWLNLPAPEKLRPAEYHDLTPEQIPQVALGPHRALVLGGTLDAEGHAPVSGPIQGRATQPHLWDMELNGETPVPLTLDPELNTLVFLYEGSLSLAGETLEGVQLVQVQHEGRITLTAKGAAKLLFLAGRPLAEPVAQHGPFVMNTRAQLEDAIRDYQMGTLTD